MTEFAPKFSKLLEALYSVQTIGLSGLIYSTTVQPLILISLDCIMLSLNRSFSHARRSTFLRASPKPWATSHVKRGASWRPYAQSASEEPFRKSLKKAIKEKKLSNISGFESAEASSQGLSNDVLDRWELTVGIEIHAQLNVDCKLFSHARSATEETVNSLTAVFDLSLPGSQPVFQPAVLVPALRAATALKCEVQADSSFDRKHYFYQDQPAGYQITQYYSPFARLGQIELFAHDGIAPEDGQSVKIGIKQIQLEQDTAKSVQQPPDTVLLDFNRVGHPLIEIISLPHIHHPRTAAAYVRKVSQMLLSVDAVTTGMELGGLRADVNVSVLRKGDTAGEHSYSGVSGLGQRTEIKNLSSFKAVEDAIVAERDRQISLLESGGQVEGETRGWTLNSTETVKLRGKEGEVDYRYMPDPDIPRLRISKELIRHIKSSLPVLPDSQLSDLTDRCGVSTKDAKTLIELEGGARVQYFHEVLVLLQQNTKLKDKEAGKVVANWVLHELGGLLSTSGQDFNERRVTADSLAQILTFLHEKKITGKTAKALLSLVYDGDARQVLQIIDEENLALQRMSPQQYRQVAQALIEDHSEMADKVRNGQKSKIQWFVGQMMRQSQGTMDAEEAKRAVQDLLDK